MSQGTPHNDMYTFLLVMQSLNVDTITAIIFICLCAVCLNYMHIYTCVLCVWLILICVCVCVELAADCPNVTAEAFHT